jgi:hypothetical protein
MSILTAASRFVQENGFFDYVPAAAISEGTLIIVSLRAPFIVFVPAWRRGVFAVLAFWSPYVVHWIASRPAGEFISIAATKVIGFGVPGVMSPGSRGAEPLLFGLLASLLIVITTVVLPASKPSRRRVPVWDQRKQTSG